MQGYVLSAKGFPFFFKARIRALPKNGSVLKGHLVKGEISEDLGSVGYKDLRGIVALTAKRNIDGLERPWMESVLNEFEKQTDCKSGTISKSLARITAANWDSGKTNWP